MFRLRLPRAGLPARRCLYTRSIIPEEHEKFTKELSADDIDTIMQRMKSATDPSRDLRQESRNLLAAAAGVPQEHLSRTVVIYRPGKVASQQGYGNRTRRWKMIFKRSERWENPLMGWSSSRDPLEMVRLSFESKDDAIHYAESTGLKFELVEDEHASDPSTPFTPNERTYGSKFNFKPPKRAFDEE